MTRSPLRSFSVGRIVAFASMLAVGFGAEAVGNPVGGFQVNDYGNAGLLQTPVAFMRDEGNFQIGVARVLPYDAIFFSATPFRWFEATFRYSIARQERYRGTDDPGAVRDKAFDFKFRLLAEGQYTPAVALGMLDIGGTGRFAGEYIVVSKQLYDLSIHGGLGWGRLGARGGIGNPFGSISNRFDDRGGRDNPGGQFEVDRWFTGPQIAPFGGVAWNPVGGAWTFVIEREGNDYQSEFVGNNQPVSAPVNVGVSYAVGPYEMAFGYERGDLLTARIAVGLNMRSDAGPPKALDPAPSPVAPHEAYAQGPLVLSTVDQAGLVRDVRTVLARHGLQLLAADLDRDERTLRLWYENSRYLSDAAAASRVVRAAAALSPPAVQRVVAIDVRTGLERRRTAVDVATLRDVLTGVQAPHGDLAHATAPDRRAYDGAKYRFGSRGLDYDWSTGPKVRQSVGDPDDPWLGQLWWRVAGELRVGRRLDVDAAIGVNIWNNFDRITRTSNSVLPRVRSDIARYLQEGENNLVQLEANYSRQLIPGWYGRVSVGVFEEMYGGVATEVLYRPFGHFWALGVELAQLRQRDFDQRFDFRDYEVTTGFLTGYYAGPTGLEVKLSVGRYLAGDRGATLDVARRFNTGARLGFFATKTNVSSEQFGEGSFDKGFYLTLPFDMFLPMSSRRALNLSFRPLTRDGGQRAATGDSLYGRTRWSE